MTQHIEKLIEKSCNEIAKEYGLIAEYNKTDSAIVLLSSESKYLPMMILGLVHDIQTKETGFVTPVNMKNLDRLCEKYLIDYTNSIKGYVLAKIYDCVTEYIDDFISDNIDTLDMNEIVNHVNGTKFQLHDALGNDIHIGRNNSVRDFIENSLKNERDIIVTSLANLPLKYNSDDIDTNNDYIQNLINRTVVGDNEKGILEIGCYITVNSLLKGRDISNHILINSIQLTTPSKSTDKGNLSKDDIRKIIGAVESGELSYYIDKDMMLSVYNPETELDDFISYSKKVQKVRYKSIHSVIKYFNNDIDELLLMYHKSR